MGFTRIDVLEKNIEHFSQPDAQYSSSGGLDSHQDFTCMYRLDETPECTVRCGIGVMIPDSLYNRCMENKSVDVVMEQFESVAALFDPECFAFGDSDGFLNDLQRTHDSCAEDKSPMYVFVQKLQDMLNAEKSGKSQYVG